MDGATLPQEVPAAHPEADGQHTFVCYSRRDIDFVLDIAARLHDRGVPVWLDLWDIRVGEDWDRAIDAALERCAAFLIVLSPDAVRSEEVRGEMRSALNAGKPIVPVLHRSCEIPRQLQNTQYLDVADAGVLTEGQLDDLAARLRGESSSRDDDARRSWRTWTPGAWVVLRLRTVGASATGAIVLVAASGLLAEASYARLFRLRPSLSPTTVLLSGLQFFITLFTLALLLTLPAALLLLVGAFLYRVGRRLLPGAKIAERLVRLLGRPGLLWTAQCATYAFLFFVSLPAFPRLLPLADVAFEGPLATRLVALGEGAYTSVVAHVVSAIVTLAALEAWRRRLNRKRLYGPPADALLSLGLALPLYLVVTAELLLLPIGHGLLNLPSQREYTAVEVTFASNFPEVELQGQRRLLLQLRPAPSYSFYCPHGPRTWDVDARDVQVVPRSRAPLARLLREFRSMPDCRIGGGLPEEVRR